MIPSGVEPYLFRLTVPSTVGFTVPDRTNIRHIKANIIRLLFKSVVAKKRDTLHTQNIKISFNVSQKESKKTVIYAAPSYTHTAKNNLN